MDVPNDVSKIFELVDFQTNDKVIGYESYSIRTQTIASLFENEQQ